MLTQFGATADSLSKASTMVFRMGTDAHLYDDPDDVSIAPLLDSKFDSEKCEALKRVLALIAQGFDVSHFFPQVVKNVASHSLEVKKLVYLYLLHYADKRPNEMLLSINYFQKDLGDPNPLVRAWALRTMAGIRMHAIAPIVMVAVGKCARDPSVYVRKCAATALPKLHDLCLEEHTASIEEIVGILLRDNSPSVVGAAAAAFTSICPNNLSLIGKNYKRLCETLPDVEEWGQIVLIGILLRYAIAKHGLVEESIMCSRNSPTKHDSAEDEDVISDKLCTEIANIVSKSYMAGPDKYLSQLGHINRDSLGLDDSRITSAKNNDDIKILLMCTSPLLWSYNSAVVLAAAGVHWIMAPKGDIHKIVKPLLFLLRSSTSSKYVILCNIQVFAKVMPFLFSPYFEDFFISSSDAYKIKTLKLEILSSIATDSSISSILLEFQEYIRDPDRRFATDTVAAIGLCVKRLSNVSNTCLEGLLVMVSESSNMDAALLGEEEIVLTQAIKSIKSIVEQNPSSHEKIIVHLMRSLDSIHTPAARSIVVWMMGEYCNVGVTMPKIMPVLFNYLASRFTSEVIETKLQIVNACVKVLLRAEAEYASALEEIVHYILELAKYDMKYDVRDRAQILKSFLSSCKGLKNDETKGQYESKTLTFVLADHVFGRHKGAPVEPFSYRFYLPGTLSQIVLHAAPGYEPLPEPCSLIEDETNYYSINGVQGTNQTGFSSEETEPNETDDSDAVSDYGSQDSNTGSESEGGSYNSASSVNVETEVNPLIHLSEASRNNIDGSIENSVSGLDDFGELMSKRALESWLNEDGPGSSQVSSRPSPGPISLARISMKDIGRLVKPKSYKLLDPAIGNGLSVDYVYTTEVSKVSSQHLCLEVCFKNSSDDNISCISLSEEEPNKGSDSFEQSASESDSFIASQREVQTRLSMEDVISLEPGQTTQRILHVLFEHHLLPLKLVLSSNGRKYPVKLRPDIGYFIKPLPMDVEAFLSKESQLPGMFEYIRRCTFTDHISKLNEKVGRSLIKDDFLMICEKLSLKMLSNANVHLVSVDMPVAAKLDDISGLCLRLSGEILSNSMPCLITLILGGNCTEPLEVSVKINCEETVFGLNLLNRIVSFLAEPTM